MFVSHLQSLIGGREGPCGASYRLLTCPEHPLAARDLQLFWLVWGFDVWRGALVDPVAVSLPPAANDITLELTEQPPLCLSCSMGIYVLTLQRPGPADSPTLVSGFLVLPFFPGQALPGQVTWFLWSAITTLVRMESSLDHDAFQLWRTARSQSSLHKDPFLSDSRSILWILTVRTHFPAP